MAYDGKDYPIAPSIGKTPSRKFSKSGRSKKVDKRSTRKYDERSSHKSKSVVKKTPEKVVPTKLGAALDDGKDESYEMSSYGDEESDDYVGVEVFKEYRE